MVATAQSEERLRRVIKVAAAYARELYEAYHNHGNVAHPQEANVRNPQQAAGAAVNPPQAAAANPDVVSLPQALKEIIQETVHLHRNTIFVFAGDLNVVSPNRSEMLRQDISMSYDSNLPQFRVSCRLHALVYRMLLGISSDA